MQKMCSRQLTQGPFTFMFDIRLRAGAGFWTKRLTLPTCIDLLTIALRRVLHGRAAARSLPERWPARSQGALMKTAVQGHQLAHCGGGLWAKVGDGIKG